MLSVMSNRTVLRGGLIWAALILAAWAVVFGVFLAGRAAAQTVTGPAALTASYAEAVAYWGGEPSWCASVELSEGVVEGELGHADIPTAFGDECGIVLAPGLDGCLLASVMRHEVGHLRGLGHSADPANVMYPEVTDLLCPAPEAPAAAPAPRARPRKACRRTATRRAACRRGHRRTFSRGF